MYRDITDVTLFDTTTNQPVVYLDYLKTSSMTVGNEIVYSQGGRLNPKLVGFQSQNEMKFELECALLSPELLAIMFGTSVTTGTQYVPVTEKITATSYTFNVSAATPYVGDLTTYPFTVSYASDGSNPSVNLTKVSGAPAATEFSLSSNTVTVNSTSYASGGTFIVTYYKASTASNKRVKFQSDKATQSYKVTGYTLWKNQADDKLYPCRITIPKLQIEINGSTLNSAAAGEPTSLKFGGQALKTPTTTDLIVYDIDSGEIIS